MTVAFSHADFRWLTEPDAPAFQISETADVLRHDIPMPPDMGHGWIENHHLALGMNISRGHHYFTAAMAGQEAPFARITAELPENALSIQSAQRGRVRLIEGRVGVELRFGEGLDLMHHIDRLDMTPCLDASGPVEVTMLKIGDSVLHCLLGEATAQALLGKLGLDAVPSARTYPTPKPLAALLHASLTSTLHGAPRILFAQAKVLEYLCGLAQHLTVDGSETVSVAGRRERIQQLREELIHLEGKIPTLDCLSQRYGLSARTLNNDFKETFGQSIVAFVTGQRLAQAHNLLQNSTIAMKQLADRLGYSHVNHFINAFRRQYGYPPGQLRGGRRVNQSDLHNRKNNRLAI